MVPHLRRGLGPVLLPSRLPQIAGPILRPNDEHLLPRRRKERRDIGTERGVSAFVPGDHGTTFGGGPFVSSVALHVLERLSDPELLAHVREDGAWMGSELNRMAQGGARIRAVRGVGFMWGIDVVASASEIVSRALNAGLLICTAGEHTIRLLPPLIATREDLRRGLALLADALA